MYKGSSSVVVVPPQLNLAASMEMTTAKERTRRRRRSEIRRKKNREERESETDPRVFPFSKTNLRHVPDKLNDLAKLSPPRAASSLPTRPRTKEGGSFSNSLSFSASLAQYNIYVGRFSIGEGGEKCPDDVIESISYRGRPLCARVLYTRSSIYFYHCPRV